jgi:hypothetical protein
MKALLQASTGSINLSRYIRLMILCGIDVVCTVPLATWGLYNQMTLDVVVPWPGFKAVHSSPSLVNQIPSVLWRSDHNSVIGLELTRWSSVMCAIIFFIFFGFADEARRNYSSALRSVAKRVGYTSFQPDFSASWVYASVFSTSSFLDLRSAQKHSWIEDLRTQTNERSLPRRRHPPRFRQRTENPYFWQDKSLRISLRERNHCINKLRNRHKTSKERERFV